MKEKHIASVSFGKDSLATLLLAKEHGEPLDEAVYCEVMFDKDISGEVPEHRDFIYETAIPRLEEMGVRIIVLRSAKTYVDLFTGRVTRGPKRAWCAPSLCAGSAPSSVTARSGPSSGIKKTCRPERSNTSASPKMSRNVCCGWRTAGRYPCWQNTISRNRMLGSIRGQKAGLLSPVYAFTDRGGCWFCPNAKLPELRHLYDCHPDLWARMLELQAIPGKTTEKFNRTQKFSDIDAMFRLEDSEAAPRQAA